MTKSQLKQLISEVIQEYKSTDAEFQSKAAGIAASRGKPAQASRFADRADTANLKNAVGDNKKLFNIRINDVWPFSWLRGGKILLIAGTKKSGDSTLLKFAYSRDGSDDILQFRTREPSQSTKHGFIRIFHDKNQFDAVATIDGKEARNIQFDRQGVITIHKITGIPTNIIPRIEK
jgi:hypothetical protein